MEGRWANMRPKGDRIKDVFEEAQPRLSHGSNARLQR